MMAMVIGATVGACVWLIVEPGTGRPRSRTLAWPSSIEAKSRYRTIDRRVGPLVAGVAVSLVWLPLGLVVGIGAPLLMTGLERAKRASAEERNRAAVPEVIDLVTVVIGSGGTIAESIRVVGRRGPPPVRSAIDQLHLQLRAGTPLGVALSPLADRLDNDYRPLLAALLATERDGAPMATLLARLGDEARAVRRRRSEVRSRRLPVQLLFPLVLCSLPAVVIGAVIPMVLLSVDRL